MRLYVPRNMTMPMDAKEDEYVMTMEDCLDLKAMMEHFDSFEELRKCVGKNFKKEKIKVRFSGLEDIWDESRLPKGSLRETFNAVLNVFGDISGGGKIKGQIPTNIVTARVADEFGVEFKTAKTKMKALMHGLFLREELGKIQFPIEFIKKGG